jgi:hypothetical protein
MNNEFVKMTDDRRPAALSAANGGAVGAPLPKGVPLYRNLPRIYEKVVEEGWVEDPRVALYKCPMCNRPRSGYEAKYVELWKVLIPKKNGSITKHEMCDVVVRNTNNRVKPVWASTRKHACRNPNCEYHISLDRRFNISDDIMKIVRKIGYKERAKVRGKRKKRRRA